MKQLNLREIHKLYLLLRHCLPENEERYLIDEIEGMVDRMDSGDVLVQAIQIMFPKLKFNSGNPLELLLLFVKGLKQNSFFEYAVFINEIKRGRRTN